MAVRNSYKAALALALAALTLAACGGDDSSDSSSGDTSGKGLEKTSIKVGTLKIGDLVGMYVAQDQGFFKEEGLTVTNVEMAGGAAIQPAVQSGQLDMGWSNVVSMVIAQTKGFDFRLMGAGVTLGPGHYENQVVLVLKDSPIKTPQQLAGKTIGLNTLGNINELGIKSYLQRHGVDLKSVRFVELGTPNGLPPLAQKRVDAIAANEPVVTLGTSGTGPARVLITNPFDSFGERPFLAGWMSTSKWLEENPKTAAAFMRAIEKAAKHIEQNPEAGIDALVKHSGLKADVARKMVQTIYTNKVTPADIEPWVKQAKQFGLTDKEFDPAQVLWQRAQ
jgi:NitT/TauT family transport system substrate-binding protein